MLRRSNRALKLKENSSHDEPPTKRKCKHDSDSEVSDSSFEDNSSGDVFVPIHSTEKKESCTLNLSESDSDNEVQDSKNIKAKQFQQSDTESEEDEICQTNFDFTNFLNSQSGTKLKETEVKSQSVNTTDINGPYNNLDVAKILSVGEGVNLGTVKELLNNTDNNAEEELKREDNYTIPDMVEVNVKLPNDIKCKKGQDMQNLLRRRMNMICKETQILIHKVNLLLWISYGNNLNGVINSPEVMGSALSLIPSKKAYPPKQCDLNYLENYIAWFSKKIKISSKINPLNKITILSLAEQFSNCEAKTRYELIVMFISMLRSLGLHVRLVVNINAVPIKPTSEQLLGPLTDEYNMKPSSSKSKVKIKQETLAKSEYFSTKSNKLKGDLKILDKKKNKSVNDDNKSKNKKSKLSEKLDENISTTDEEEDTIFVKSNKKKSEYFKSNKSQVNVNKSVSKMSKPVLNNKTGKNKKSIISQKIDRRVLSTDEEDNSTLTENNETKTKKKIKNDFWAEVFLEMEEKWFCVDVIGQRLHCIKEIYVSCLVINLFYICKTKLGCDNLNLKLILIAKTYSRYLKLI